MQHPNPGDHARHDALLIAGHAAGELTDTDRARADALIAECAECGALRRDLVALAAATRSVPAPAMRTRDLRLSAEQADRLRRGSWLRTFLRPFVAAGSPIRPAAAAFTSLGVVGLVIGITLSNGAAMVGGAAGTGQERAIGGPAASNPPKALPEGVGAPDESYRAVVAAGGQSQGVSDLLSVPPVRTSLDSSSGHVPAPRPTSTDLFFGVNRDSAGGHEGQVGAGGADAAGDERDTSSTTGSATESSTLPPSPLIAGSLALLGIGLLLFGLRIASRRVR